MMEDFPFNQEVLPLISNSKTDNTDRIRARLRAHQSTHDYEDIALVDVNGQVHFRLSGRTQPLSPDTMERLQRALREEKPELTRLRRSFATDAPLMDVVVPLFVQEKDRSAAVAGLVFSVDLQLELYPLMQFQTMAGPSAATLLVRRDGNDALFLTEPRHLQAEALRFRVPLTNVQSTAVSAVSAVQGKEGSLVSNDYRGVKVLFTTRAVSNAPWFIVAKIDYDEIFADGRRRLALMGLLFLTLSALLFTTGLFLWQRGRRAHFQALFETEASRRVVEERYQTTLMSVGEGIAATDAEGRIQLLNSVAERLTGRARKEAISKPIEEVFQLLHEDTRLPEENPARRALLDGVHTECADNTVLVAADGVERPIALSGSPIRDDAGAVTGAVLVCHDMTERRAAQKALKLSEERFRLIFENANIGVCLLDTQGRFM